MNQITWEGAQEVMKGFRRDYSMDIPQQEIVFKYAQQVPKGGLMLEIGICCGSTGAVMGYVANSTGAEYVGIDNFSLVQNEQEVRDAFLKTGFPCTIIHANSQAYDWVLPIDLLEIDGDHAMGVENDCRIYIPHVKPGGIVMFHDFDQSRTAGHAHEAIWRFGDAWTPGWEELDFCNGLMIKQKPL